MFTKKSCHMIQERIIFVTSEGCTVRPEQAPSNHMLTALDTYTSSIQRRFSVQNVFEKVMSSLKRKVLL